jgi:hypothetical protein
MVESRYWAGRVFKPNLHSLRYYYYCYYIIILFIVRIINDLALCNYNSKNISIIYYYCPYATYIIIHNQKMCMCYIIALLLYRIVFRFIFSIWHFHQMSLNIGLDKILHIFTFLISSDVQLL